MRYDFEATDVNYRLQCANGHEWMIAAGAADETVDHLPDCPTCGSPGRLASSPGTGPTLPGSGETSAAAPVQANVPGYDIVRELGRGGMGVVYLARHKQLGRLVALKMILSGVHAGEKERHRFQSEATAVAKLQHPNIVQIYEIGEADGHPFFSLEYVDGGSLAEKLGGTPLPPREAAQFVVPLSRAIQAAHECGIVHRDLKPANILLSKERGTRSAESIPSGRSSAENLRAPSSALRVPKITDFGLAKDLQSHDGPTQSGAIMGTPSYMAPEQASGQAHGVGPPADIYALGAILYELITGRPPFRGATPLETVIQVTNDEPVPPTQLQPKCPRDLETICLKCLQKDARKRYATAGESADDLERFLKAEPIFARPIGRIERGWRWMVRNPVTSLLLAALALVLIVSFVTVVALWRLAERDKTRADQQEARAKANLLKAVEAVDRMLTRVADERLAYVPQFEDERRQILEEAVGFYREFLEQDHTDPALRREMGRACTRLGKVFFNLGRQQQAQDAYAQARQLQEQLHRESPGDPTHAHDLALTLMDTALSYRMTNQLDEAAAPLQQAQELVEELVRQSSADPTYRETRAALWVQLGYLEFQRAHLEPAEKFFQKGIDEYEDLVKQRGNDFKDRLNRAKAYNALAFFRLSLGRYPDADRYATDAVKELEALTKEYPEKTREIEPFLAEARVNLAVVYSATKRGTKADAVLRETNATFDRLVRDYPKSPYHRFIAARGLQAAAMRSQMAGNPEEAEKALKNAVDLLQQLHKNSTEMQIAEQVLLPYFYAELSQLHRKQNKLSEAMKELEQAKDLLASDTRGGARGPFRANELRLQLARMHVAQKQFAEAQKEVEDAIEAARKLGPSDRRASQEMSNLHLHHAITRVLQGDHASALTEALAATGPNPKDLLAYNLACVHALCAKAIKNDPRLATPEREEKAEAQAGKAMELLTALRSAGYFRAPNNLRDLRTDTDLDVLRPRPEFIKLQKEVEAKGEALPKADSPKGR
jgi:serine/threonine protein kinase